MSSRTLRYTLIRSPLVGVPEKGGHEVVQSETDKKRSNSTWSVPNTRIEFFKPRLVNHCRTFGRLLS